MDENMAQKIKKLRRERGMTLEEVAQIVGVGKSTVRKWETGMIANMKRDKILALANALGTTPEYLMGWEIKKESPANELAEDETLLIELFRSVPDDKKDLALEMIRAALKAK